MATFCVVQSVTNSYEGGQRFKTRPPADALLDTHRRAGSFARLLRWDSETHCSELAHVRNGLLYEGMSSQVDWADTLQVVEIWERAKQAIRERLDEDKSSVEFSRIVTDVVETMDLPDGWEERLQAAVQADAESTTVFLG